MTEKLYEKDAYQISFEAAVLQCREKKRNQTDTEVLYEIELDRTCFYPEGGGQPADNGTLADVEVLDVQEEDGIIWHTCTKPLKEGSMAKGSIDWKRRFTHMQQHTGEHIISGIICGKYGCHNIGFHMGKEAVTIDFDKLLSEEEVKTAEHLANKKVMENVETKAWYPLDYELCELNYRSKKEIQGAVRIVEIPGADICACCGTHVKRTGEVGPLKVTGLEHYKNGVRLTLLIGWQALLDYEKKHENIRRICGLLSVKPEDCAQGVERLLKTAEDWKGQAVALRGEKLMRRVSEIAEGTPFCMMAEEGLNAVEVRRLADALMKKADMAVVLNGSDSQGYQYVIASLKEDVTAFGKEFNRALNGKGGGKNPMIQGAVSATMEEITRFFKTKERNFS